MRPSMSLPARRARPLPPRIEAGSRTATAAEERGENVIDVELARHPTTGPSPRAPERLGERLGVETLWHPVGADRRVLETVVS